MALENWTKCFDNGKGYCTYCGVDLLASISSFWSAQRDHVHTRAAGGNNDVENMVIVCPSCNQALSRQKNIRTIPERKAYIAAQYKKRESIYAIWLEELRGSKVTDCHCSFCGAEETQAAKLLVGPNGVSICSGCIDACCGNLLFKHGTSMLPTIKQLSETGTINNEFGVPVPFSNAVKQ